MLFQYLSRSKKSLKENGNGWEYTGNNYCDFTHNMGLAVRIFFCNGYFGIWLFKPSLISFFQTLYSCRIVLVCEYTVVSSATFKSANFEFFRISGFYIKYSQSGFTGGHQPDWYKNNPNPSTVHSTFLHGNSSMPICYYGLKQKQRDPRPVIGRLILQNMNLAYFKQVFQTPFVGSKFV